MSHVVWMAGARTVHDVANGCLMLPSFHSTSGGMTDTSGDEGWLYRWTLSGSLAVHALAAFLLIFGCPCRCRKGTAPAINVAPQPEPRRKRSRNRRRPSRLHLSSRKRPKQPLSTTSAIAADEAAERPPEMPVLDPVYHYGKGWICRRDRRQCRAGQSARAGGGRGATAGNPQVTSMLCPDCAG